MAIIDEIKIVLKETLQLGNEIESLDSDTPLLGGIPEFDSMSVVSVITALEEKYGIIVEDDEINGEIFETIGSLSEFIERKLE